MPTIVDHHQVAANAAILVRMADLMEIPYLVTEQYPKGLGRTVEAVSEAMADRSRRVEKTRFSAMVDVVEDELLVPMKGQRPPGIEQAHGSVPCRFDVAGHRELQHLVGLCIHE